jgi:ribonuclease P protein component
VKRSFRLTSTTDFKRVRRFGKSYAHPLLVLVAFPDPGERTRVGIAASRAVGKAVERNRAKRLVRAAIHSLLPGLPGGWKVVILCRRPILDSSLLDITQALDQLLNKAGMV